VVKPVVRLDEPGELGPPTLEYLVERFGMRVAPPNSQSPAPALVSADFPRNVARLLVLVPSSGSPAGAWNAHEPAAQMLSWAEANGYATALFRAEALEAAPHETWDRVLRGSPAGCVAVVAASGTLPVLQAALLPLHPLLLSRFRAVCAVPEGGAGSEGAPSDFAGQWLAELPPGSEELRGHLRAALVRLPAPAGREPRAWHQHLFELLQEREDRFQRTEAKKYAGFQGLQENDMPGFRRLPMEKRIERLDRDRGNDELARLLHKHERQTGADAHESEEEPGVD